MARSLAANVYVDGVLYRSGSTPPTDVAKQITNPKAWGRSADAPKSTEVDQPSASAVGPAADAEGSELAPTEDDTESGDDTPTVKVRRKGSK